MSGEKTYLNRGELGDLKLLLVLVRLAVLLTAVKLDVGHVAVLRVRAADAERSTLGVDVRMAARADRNAGRGRA